MKRALLPFALPLALLVPWLLGLLMAGPSQQAGRSSRSTTRVGHKALALVLEGLGFEVRRHERALASLPEGPAVLVALEPGALFPKEARALSAWIERGNGALITLGPDPDKRAEEDDRDDALGDRTSQAVAQLRKLQTRAKERASPREEGEPGAPAPSSPGESKRPAPEEAVEASDLALAFALPLAERRHDGKAPCTVEGPLAPAGATIALTRPRTFVAHEGLEVLLSACGAPILVRAARGKGELLVLSEPRLLHNAKLGVAAHGAVAVGAVVHLARAVGASRVLFEEWTHGARAIPNAFALATRTGARWPLLQLGLAAVVFAFAAARRRSPVSFSRPPVRMKRESIEAIARLLERTGDVGGAARRLAALTRARLSRERGKAAASAPPPEIGSSPELVELARQMRAERLSTRGKGAA